MHVLCSCSCLPLHTHAGKEEELLQRQGTATFLFKLGPCLCTCMLRYLLLFISWFNSLLSPTAGGEASDGDQEEWSSYND